MGVKSGFIMCLMACAGAFGLVSGAEAGCYRAIRCSPRPIVAPCTGCAQYFAVRSVYPCPDGRWHVTTSIGGYYMPGPPRDPGDAILRRPNGDIVWADRRVAMANGPLR